MKKIKKDQRKYSFSHIFFCYHLYSVIILFSINLLIPISIRLLNLVFGIIIGIIPYLLVAQFMFHNVRKQKISNLVMSMLAVVFTMIAVFGMNGIFETGYCAYDGQPFPSDAITCGISQLIYIAMFGYSLGFIYFLVKLFLKLQKESFELSSTIE